MKNTHPILIVENDDDDRSIILQAFAQIGKAEIICFFSSSCELFDYLAGVPTYDLPGLIVLDYNMPDCNGLETVQKLQNLPLIKDIPVVVYTSAILPDAKKELMKYNVITCLQKGDCMEKLAEQARYFTELLADDVDLLLGTR
jgi:CheY-like chemotaxis protein